MLTAAYDLFVLSVDRLDLIDLCNVSLMKVDENFILFFCCGASARYQIMASIYGASRSHSSTPHLVGLLWMSDKADAETSSDYTQQSQETKTSMPLVGFEPTISANERPQTNALDRAATGIGGTLHGIFHLPNVKLYIRIQ
jgi:hypothetical protein